MPNIKKLSNSVKVDSSEIETARDLDQETIDALASAEDSEIVEDSETELSSLPDLDSESSDEVKKLRGKRQIFFYCAANLSQKDNNVLAGEEIAITMSADESFDQQRGREEAVQIFKNKHQVSPAIVWGPCYQYRGGSGPKRRETISVSVAKEAPFTAERGRAIHSVKGVDWKVLVNFTTRPDTAYVFYDGLVDPSQVKDKNKIQKPTARFLPTTALRGLERNSTPMAASAS